jgi:hypothetical protein
MLSGDRELCFQDSAPANAPIAADFCNKIGQ